MDDLSEKLSQILNDPGSLRQIMEVAGALGLNAGSPGETGGNRPSTPPPEALEDLSRLIKQAEKADKKQDALFRALQPYLKPQRQARLERAMQVAHLSHLAGAALRSGQLGRTPEQEEHGHV